MSKEYGLKFGSGSLSLTSGLAPTFTHFVRLDTGATLAPPGITQIIVGIGMYKFNYTPSFPVYFEVDGATTGLGSDRYISGILDPIDQIDSLNAQLGATNQAIGATITGYVASLSFSSNAILARIGQTNSSFGDDSTDATTLYGYLKRLQEIAEGNAVYTKATGIWQLYSRGSSTLLRTKTLDETATIVNKT